MVDFINKNTPDTYDYPVTDVVVEPIAEGDAKFVQWVKDQTAEGKGFKYSEVASSNSDEVSLY